MKFGKLDDISQVDFSLPEDQPDRLLGLERGQPGQDFSAYVGCPMWGNKDWIGKLYPKGTKQGEFLHHYSRAFNTIEMNTTHYRSPSLEMVARWKEKVPANFVFCPKMPQTISHYAKLQGAETQTRDFCDAVKQFEDNLGCVFMQLHESFGPQRQPVLAEYLSNFSPEIPFAIEFRHPGWFQNQQLIPDLYELLYHFRVSAVITDVAGRRDVLHTSLPHTIAMIRFVGNGLVPTDYHRADAWMDRIAQWVDQGLKYLYFFVHEPDDTNAPEMGVYVLDQLNAKLGLDLHVPSLTEHSGTQMRLF